MGLENYVAIKRPSVVPDLTIGNSLRSDVHLYMMGERKRELEKERIREREMDKERCTNGLVGVLPAFICQRCY